MKRFIILSLVVMAAFSTACQSVTVIKDGGSFTEGEPTYQKSLPYFIFGAVGKRDVYVDHICNGKTPAQFQAQTTFLDGFLGFITIGIYTPRSVKVWCTNGEA